MHGGEYASMAGLRRWASGLEGRAFRGTVRAVPVVNQPAFWARSPFVVPEDGKNLNRTFPGAPDGTLTERIADAVYSRFILGSDALVDMHAGDMVEALEPFALYDAGPAEAGARGLAAAYGVRYVLRNAAGPALSQPASPPPPPVNGSSSAVAAAAGIPAIIAEAGGCGLVEEEAVRAHVRGLDGVLAHLEMAPGQEMIPGPAGRAAEPEYLSGWSWPRTPSAGWWSPAVRPGDRVAAGQLLGTVETLDGGTVLETFTAPADGVVLFLTSSPAVAADGLLLGLASA